MTVRLSSTVLLLQTEVKDLPIPPELLGDEYSWKLNDLDAILDFYFNNQDISDR